jgi:pimeloyl-ACP methyl ester carboxylesterase
MTRVKFLRYFTVLAVVIVAGGSPGTGAQSKAANTFRVFVRGIDTGIEEVTLLESAEGHVLRGSGKLRPPLNLSIDYWEARYDRDWKPLELTVQLTENANRWTVHTMFGGTSASTDVEQNGQTQRRTTKVAADTIALPNLIFGAYEALAARLATARVGSELEGYIAPQDAVAISVTNVTEETIQIPGRKIAARRFVLHVGGAASKLDMEVWTEAGRLLRIDIPAQMLSILRDDIASVSARLVTMARPNDEQISVPAIGFSLSATLSQPGAAEAPPAAAGRKPVAARLPAVILVSGSSPSDRDEIIAGIPLFAQLANALADAGYVVVRYDERGSGQSGGRLESATLDDLAADARAVYTFVAKRRDVDPRRVAIVGYGEGGWLAMLVAAREERLAGLALVATPSTSGTQLVLEQQRQLLERNGTSGQAQQAAIEQQKKIIDAVVAGTGWDQLTPEIRRRVDTPLYRSFLTFDPAKTLARLRQPMLIVQPQLDREVPAYHGEQLAQLARARPRVRETQYVALPGLNHLLARAESGEVAEYGTLPERAVGQTAIAELTSWLGKVLAQEPSK